MNSSVARAWLGVYLQIPEPTEEEKNKAITLLNDLINEENDSNAMLTLGGIYYEDKEFEKAEHLYLMAAELNNVEACSCLGYVYYYGRTGKRDYEKAYKYFNLAAKAGDKIAAYKIADMHKNGYFVEKNYDEYANRIEALWDEVVKTEVITRNGKEVLNNFNGIVDIMIRLAEIRAEKGQIDDAIELYETAREYHESNMSINAYWGNHAVMRRLVEGYYKICDFNYYDFYFYDLYYLLKEEHKISFKYDDIKQYVQSKLVDGKMIIIFNDETFDSLDEFMYNAALDGFKLSTLQDRDLEMFKLEV